MLKVIRVGRPPYAESELARLRLLEGPFFHPDPEQESWTALEKAGFSLTVLPEEVSQGVLLMPAATGSVERLVGVVDRLLGPGGCPWDQAQTHETLKRYLLEEAYELFDAIDHDDKGAMEEELGDILLQPILHAAMLRRDGFYDVDAIATHVADKLVRRHPHVFGDLEAADVDQVLKNWDTIKKAEKGDPDRSVLAGVPKAMPALLRAYEISKRAARQGFEWPDLDGVWDKFAEETAELREAIDLGEQDAIASELGDLLFTIVNLSRWLKVEPEEALSRMLNRFQARFEYMESNADLPLGQLSQARWDELWQDAKLATRNNHQS